MIPFPAVFPIARKPKSSSLLTRGTSKPVIDPKFAEMG